MAPTNRLGAHMGMMDREHTRETDRQIGTIYVALRDRQGARMFGTHGQTRSTHIAVLGGHGAHVALMDSIEAHHVTLMDKEHMYGTDGETRTTCMELMDRLGAHAWHCHMGMEHM